MHHLASFYLLTFTLCLLITDCKKRETLVERNNHKDIFHISVDSEPSNLDPHTITDLSETKLVQTMFDPLINFEPGTLAPVPTLAANWDISANDLIYTFHLHPNTK